MTKEQVKQRLMDIAAGAGMWIEEDDGSWGGMGPVTLYRLMAGIEIAFNLNRSSDIVAYWNLPRYHNIDTLTDLVHKHLDFLSEGE